ncbi:response regulator [Roseovarius sp. Pro17]|uniref:response regulator n=1 Tax=Roseovarius sp. Pro17 TaxID=3108175 RepID=UPI002D765376|nr:response regulator [Roseovarius sp. Pro17]
MIKVLHVEDDADIREISQMALALSGEFLVMQSKSGEEALKQAETFRPDVILLDVMMPGMTGPQTLERMRQLPSVANVPAIFMTARTQQIDIDGLLRAGAVDVISKPFDPMSLGHTIREILDGLRQQEVDEVSDSAV